MNASVNLLERALPATVYLQVQIPVEHASAAILGTDRAASGTLVDANGLILTTQYIVMGARRIEVTLVDGTTMPGEVTARDFFSGIAVVKIDGRSLPAVPLASSTDLVPGEDVFLVASAGDNARRTNCGVVMSLDPFDAYWEYSLNRAITCTAVNPGLSGGTMFDRRGRMVGVVALDLNEIGRMTMAIPVENFLDHRDELLQHGRRVSRPPRAWVGLYCYSFRDRLVIAGVLPGTPAEVAGLKPGDILLTVDDLAVMERRTLYHQLWTHRPGDAIDCTVHRNNEVKRVTVHGADVEEFFA